MSHPGLPDPSQYPRRHLRAQTRPLAPAAFIGLAALGAIVIGVDAFSAGDPDQIVSPAVVEAAPVAVTTVPPTTEPALDTRDVDLEGCMLDVVGVKVGDDGPSVDCTQRALAVTGYYAGPIDGVFTDTLADAAVKFQVDNDLYVDGIVGRRTATALGIWPGQESFIVRTPVPAPGTYDATGFELSPVASAGSDAPPLPDGADQASGARIVYDRSGQRVWAIDDNENVVRSYLVSGSQFANELPGVYTVYSKSEVAKGWNLEADLPFMVRYQKTERGNIGFHQIPIKIADGSKYQTIDQLGERLSGGCQRQHPLDARFMWSFADVGTTVIVI